MLRHANLDAALRRLVSAVDQLEAATGRLAQTGTEKADLEQALGVMQHDRSRLALELDAVLFRANALEHANHEVAKRLNEAGGVLRHLLASPAQDLASPAQDLASPAQDLAGPVQD